jgi:hypothetical protein
MARVYFGVNTEVAGIQNQINSSLPETNRGLWRFDVAPTLRAPLSKLSFLSATASGSSISTSGQPCPSTAAITSSIDILRPS